MPESLIKLRVKIYGILAQYILHSFFPEVRYTYLDMKLFRSSPEKFPIYLSNIIKDLNNEYYV